MIVSKEFYNYFTTPSGKYCTVREISNREYLVICKFTESQNVKGLFEYVDKIIKETISDFDDFTISDKLYAYIALTLYTIKAVIGISTKPAGSQKVSLVSILNAIEEEYDEKVHLYKVGNVELEIKPPKKVLYGENNSLDFLSGISSVKMNGSSIEISNEQRDTLIKSLSQQALMDIQWNSPEWLKTKINIFKGLPMPSYNININSSDSINLAFSIMGESLESFYWKQFVAIHYLRVSYEGVMEMTPLEIDIMIKNFQKIQEESNKDKQAMQPTAAMTDPIM